MRSPRGTESSRRLLFLWLLLSLQSRVAFCSRGAPLSHRRLCLGALEAPRWGTTAILRKTAYIQPPLFQGSRGSYCIAPRGHKTGLGALQVDNSPVPGSGQTKQKGFLVKLWTRVKRLFSSAVGGATVPVVPGSDGTPVVPQQGLRGYPPLSLPINLGVGATLEESNATGISAYTQLVRLQPSAVINQFMEKAPQRVKDAARSTVGALVGSFYRYCIETTLITSSDRLSVLIHSMQMTGYMLWNAECRYCLSERLLPESVSKEAVGQKPQNQNEHLSQSHDASADPKTKNMALVPPVRDELVPSYSSDSLLSYIRSMPDKTANSLLDNMSTGVMDAMQESIDMTVESLTGTAAPTQSVPGHSHRVIVQQTGSACVQLCLWHVALGYCLRDQEAKLELQNALNSG